MIYLLALPLSYFALSHVFATVGMPRPRSQRTRLSNSTATAIDLGGYVGMYWLMKATGASSALVTMSLIGAGAHLVYLVLQIPDSWYRRYIDDYRESTIVNGLLLKYKIPVAAIDSLFYVIGLWHMLASLPIHATALPAALGALLCVATWKPGRSARDHASHVN